MWTIQELYDQSSKAEKDYPIYFMVNGYVKKDVEYFDVICEEKKVVLS